MLLRENDVGMVMADVCCSRLQELNSKVTVEIEREFLLKAANLKRYSVSSTFLDNCISSLSRFSSFGFQAQLREVVVSSSILDEEELSRMNSLCRASGVGFVATATFGLFGCVFVDAGPSHSSTDPRAEELKTGLIDFMSVGSLPFSLRL